LPAIEHAEQILRNHGFDYDQAPSWNPPPQFFPLSQNYAQNLLRNGYWHADSLRQNLMGSRRLLEVRGPDLVLAEHAPTVLLAARAAGIPRAAIGTGFALPPLTSPMPGLQAWFSIPEKHLLRKERTFLDTVNPVLREIGHSPLSAVADIFQGAEIFLCTYPEFDHYEHRENMTYWGPIIHSAQETTPQWPSGSADNIFVYMHSRDKAFRPLMDLVRRMQLPTLAFVPDLTERERRSLEGDGCVISPQAVDLRSARDHCRFAVTSGGHNAGALMLLQGIPLLLCPRNLEQEVWAYQISRQGLAVVISYFDLEPDYEGKISTMLNPGALADRVRVLSGKYRSIAPQEGIRRITNQCIALVEGK
jgi:UDP:flavonoid glycosyltransferase YjiC (YdhE family)